MADGKIYIIVTDQLPNGQGPITPDKVKKDEDDKKSPLKDFAQHRFFNFIESQAKQAVSYTISNIGNFTGDYVTQQHMQDTVKILSALGNIGMAAIAGAKYGPYGALIGATIATAGQVITQTQQLVLGYSQNELQNRRIDQLRTRAGLNSNNNGSRGTEY